MQVNSFSCRQYKSNPLKKVVTLIVFITITICVIYNMQIIPAIIPFVEAQVSREVTMRMHKEIKNCVAGNDYADLVSLKYNENGDVVSLETKMANISVLNTNITEKTIESLCNLESFTVSIPIGNITGGAIFSGKGPKININVMVSPKVTCRFENEFYESGINQTLHRIYAVTEAEVFALVPMRTQAIQVSSKYCITETVIVGKVPDAYTKINRLDDELSESDIDDIYDFGATLQ